MRTTGTYVVIEGQDHLLAGGGNSEAVWVFERPGSLPQSLVLLRREVGGRPRAKVPASAVQDAYHLAVTARLRGEPVDVVRVDGEQCWVATTSPSLAAAQGWSGDQHEGWRGGPLPTSDLEDVHEVRGPSSLGTAGRGRA